MAVLQHRVPTREIRMKSQRKIWMTSELYHLSKRKFRLFKIARSTRSEDDARFRNFCTSRCRSAKANFLRRKHEEISSATDGSHRWWTLAKKLARITTPREAIQKLCTAEHTATTDFDKATLLANFFAEQCTSASPQEDMPCAPLPLPENHPTFDFPPISELTVLRTLQHLPVNKSTADPLLTNLVLRECAPVITPSVSYLINLSVSTGVFPAMWKQALLCLRSKTVGKLKIRRTIAQFRCYQLLAKPLTRYRPLTFCNIWWSKSLSRLISSGSCLKSQQHCKCCTWLIIGSGHWREVRMSLQFS